jgi:peptide/nickel transport system substrate-binding protein
MTIHPRRVSWLALSCAVSLTLLLFGARTASAVSHTGKSPADTLVAAMFFDGKSLDPGREFENMGNAADHAMYDTLVTFANGNLTKVVPDLATSWKSSSGGKVYTFTLRSGVRFSSGNPVTAADVVWSLEREINLTGNPSFLLASVASISAPTSMTVRMVLKHPDPATLFILPNPSLSILDSKVVKAHGGSDAPNADKVDTAEPYLNAHSAGSGPYMLTSYSPGNSIAMTTNPNYWGKPPLVKKLLILNQQASTEILTLAKGDTDVGVNLSANQVPALRDNTHLTTYGLSSPNIFFLILNMDPGMFKPTANNDVRQAIRYALDYKGLVTLAGSGAVQSPGVIPVQFLGGLPASANVQQNVAKAKALLAKAGYPNGFNATMEFPSDITIAGIDFNLFAQKLQSDLAAVGITVKLLPKPIAVSLPDYRGGKEQIGFWEWGPDYPDPEDYLNFLPGQLVGLRANWKAGADPQLAAWMQQASTTLNNPARAEIYRRIQQRLAQVGPFVTMFQPAQIVATQRSVTGFHYNYIWQADFNVVGK